MAGALILQHQKNRHLHLEITSLQSILQELEATVDFSLLINEDLRAELQAASRPQTNKAHTPTVANQLQCENLAGLTSLDLFLLTAQKTTMFDSGRVKVQARVTVDTLYTDFINSYLGRDAERRLATRDILKSLEEQRIELALDYAYGRTSETTELSVLNRADYDDNISRELAKVLTVDELSALEKYRIDGFPTAVRRDISNRIDNYAKELNDDNKRLMIDGLTNIKLLELSHMDFEDSLTRQIDQTKTLQHQISTMEESQSIVAQRFLFNYTRNLQQLTQNLMTQRLSGQGK
jgi:hypothetical protein